VKPGIFVLVKHWIKQRVHQDLTLTPAAQNAPSAMRAKLALARMAHAPNAKPVNFVPVA